jgi:site-specific recombinase XerD
MAAIHALAHFIGERSPEHLMWCGEIQNVPFKRTGKNPLTYLEKAELDALLEAANPDTQQGQKDHALLLFLYNSGARASEATGVKISDLEGDNRRGGAVKLCGKGAKTRLCPLWPRTMAALAPLIAGRQGNNLVFLNRYGSPMTRFGIHTLVERHSRRAAEKVPSLTRKRVSQNTIRHTTATHLLRAGVDINTIRAWLGHVSVDTTNVYAEVDLEMKAKALAACNTGGRRREKKMWRKNPCVMKFLRSL